ncbi:hypothetical protein BJX70DRAFT_400230 [Aspergillus crustosus]
MINPVIAIRYTLFALVPFSSYTLWMTVHRAGLAAHWFAAKELPGNPEAKLFESITGLKKLDVGAKALILCFWPLCNGENPSLSLLGIPFAGSATIPYILLTLDGRRTRSVLSVAWRFAWLGVIQTFYSQALLLPLYCAITLSESPTGTTESRKPHPTPAFRSTPYIKRSLLLGFYFYLPIFALPSPSILSHALKQALIASFIGWSVWVFAVIWISVSTTPQSQPDKTKKETDDLSARRPLYIIALTTASISHLAAFLTPLFTASPCKSCMQDLRPGNVFIPALPWSVTEFESYERGVAYFFQWDYILANIALLLWAAGVYIRDCPEETKAGWGRLWWEVLGISALASPSGGAILLIWRLDGALCVAMEREKEQ